MISNSDIVIKELLEKIQRSSQQLKKVLLNLSVVTGKLKEHFLQHEPSILRVLRGGWLWRLTNPTKHNLLKLEEVRNELEGYIEKLVEQLESKKRKIKGHTSLTLLTESLGKKEVKAYHAAILEYLSVDGGKIVSNPRISKHEIKQLHDQVISYVIVVSKMNESAQKLYHQFKNGNMKALLELRP